MTACEWCWREASRLTLLSGKSTAELYEEVRREQDDIGERALCPMARSAAMSHAERGDS